jgi:two-component sensor histidine kinase
MATVHEMLYQSPDVASIEVAEFLERLAGVALHSATCICIPPRIPDDTTPVTIPIEQAVPLALITSELITNSCKHGADSKGSVRIEIGLEHRDGTIEVTVRDYGPGLVIAREGDRTRDGGSTGGGIGLELVSALCSQLRGELHFDNCNGEGTAVRIRFPEAAPNQDS